MEAAILHHHWEGGGFSLYGYVQMVDNPTRNKAVLDMIWTNMAAVYEKPVGLS